VAPTSLVKPPPSEIRQEDFPPSRWSCFFSGKSRPPVLRVWTHDRVFLSPGCFFFLLVDPPPVSGKAAGLVADKRESPRSPV